jgi:hypothetical protein
MCNHNIFYYGYLFFFSFTKTDLKKKFNFNIQKFENIIIS